MSDFSKPEYASYLALCRELKLERDFRPGDWYWWNSFVMLFGQVTAFESVHGFTHHETPLGSSWLPTLSDWLEMLEEAGQPDIEIGQSFDRDQKPDGYVAYGDTGAPWERTLSLGSGTCPTREEAAARLWMAVRKPAPVT